MLKNKRHALVSLNYFLFFSGVGAFVPYISLYLKDAGWSGASIGVYFALGPLITFLTQSLWGYIGDLWGNLRLLFALLVLLTGASIGLFAFLPVTGLFYLLALLVGFFQGPLSPMLDSMAVRILGDDKTSWGNTRLWGSIGFGVVSYFMGKLYTTKPTLLFFTYVASAILTALTIFALPFENSEAKEKNELEGFQLVGIRQVLSGPFLGYLLAMFVLQLGQYMPANFLSVVMTDRGATTSLVGLVWGAAALVEIPVFIGTSKFLNKYTPERLLTLAALFSVFRLTLFGVAHQPLLMLIAQGLEGLVFAPILVALVLISDRLIPPHLHATGFTLKVAFTVTLPQFLGGILGGRIYDAWGGTALYLTSAFFAFLGVGAFIAWQRLNPREASAQD